MKYEVTLNYSKTVFVEADSVEEALSKGHSGDTIAENTLEACCESDSATIVEEPVAEIFKEKYDEFVKNMTDEKWEYINTTAAEKNQEIAECIYMCLELTENDIAKCDAKELEMLFAKNMITGMREHFLYLTNKGFKYLNKDGSIC